MKKSTVIFLICFVLLTFAPVPVFYAFRPMIAQKNTENKAESAFPELSLSNYTTWPKRFESWLSDTLPFKTQLIELFRGTQYRLGLEYRQSDVIRGEDDTLFYRATVENYKGMERFTDDELRVIRDNLTNFFARMEGMGTKSLLYIAPDKEQVYGELMPSDIRVVSEESRADQTAAYLREEIEYPVLYEKDALKALSERFPVYFKTDTHWNELGGYFAARAIREAFTGVSADSGDPQYHYFPEDGKDLAAMLGIEEMETEPNTVLIDFNDGVTVNKTATVDHGTLQRFTSDAPAHKKLMIIGDSFSEYFLRSAIHDVDEILFVTYGELSMVDIEAEAPDYLVVMLVERNLPFLLNGFW